MNQSNRGAAQVSLMWIIAFAVIMFLSLGFGFVQNDQLAIMTQKHETAAATESDLKAQLAELRLIRAADYQHLGFGDADGKNVSVEAIDRQVAEYVSRFGLDENTITKIEDIASPVIAKYEGEVSTREGLQTEIAGLRNSFNVSAT
jgi:hypothetical protein